MKQINAFRAYLTLCILAVASLFGGVNAVAQKWVATDITELATGDVVVIADVTSARAMSNDKGASTAPVATTVTLNSDKSEITGTVADNLQWTITVSSANYQFSPVGKTTYLYCTADNNGVRVGTNTDNTFTWDANTNKLKNVSKGRWVGVYSNKDWRCYTSNHANIQATVTKFFKLENDSRQDPQLAFASEVYSLNVGNSVKAVISTVSTGTVTYTSDNTSVASVDGEGNVTALAEGTATITATIAETEVYRPATATCQIKVVDPNKPAEVVTPLQFKKVTSTGQLVDGGQYVLVCEAQNVANADYDASKYLNKVDATAADGVLELSDAFGVITLKGSTSNWSLGISNQYIGKTVGTNNDLNFSTTEGADGYKWSVDFDTEGNALIDITAYDSKNKVDVEYRLAYNSSNPRFSAYKAANYGNSTAMKIQLYRLEANASVNEKIGYTTYYTDKNYQLPEGLTAYAITEAPVAGAVTMTKAYEAGQEVPANTALLLEGAAGAYGMPVLNKEVAAYAGDNMLEGRRNSENFTESTRENVLYYKLTLKDEVPGFYWGAEGGAAFLMKNATTAYLAVPAGMASANGFRIIMDGTTGIDTVATPAKAENGIYTLAGVRVNAQSTVGLPKGIYIVNGKKLLVK